MLYLSTNLVFVGHHLVPLRAFKSVMSVPLQTQFNHHLLLHVRIQIISSYPGTQTWLAENPTVQDIFFIKTSIDRGSASQPCLLRRQIPMIFASSIPILIPITSMYILYPKYSNINPQKVPINPRVHRFDKGFPCGFHGVSIPKVPDQALRSQGGISKKGLSAGTRRPRGRHGRSSWKGKPLYKNGVLDGCFLMDFQWWILGW